MIREFYWEGLTRRFDEQGVVKILSDEKTRSFDGFTYVYVPASDSLAPLFFSSLFEKNTRLKLRVVPLPEQIDASFVRRLHGRHGLLSLEIRKTEDGDLRGTPFVMPGGRFNEMYGWDSYFITLGLLEEDKLELAKCMVDNLLYQIQPYGRILNANRTYYLTRSQAPFLFIDGQGGIPQTRKKRVIRHLAEKSTNSGYSGISFGLDEPRLSDRNRPEQIF